MTSNESLHARTLSLAHHLLQLLEACTSAPIDKPALVNLLRADPGLLANFLDTVCRRPPVAVGNDGRWLKELVTAQSDSDLQRFAVRCAQPWLAMELDHSQWLKLRQLLMHSLQAAELARQLAGRLEHLDGDEAALAGACFNLGRVMLFSQSPSRYLEHPGKDDVDERVLAEERRLWGQDHQALAARRLRHWPLDSYLADAVALLYQPADRYQNSTALVRVLHAVQCLLATAKPVPARMRQLATVTGISEAVLRQCLDAARQAAEQVSWARLDEEEFCARQREAVADVRSAVGSLALRQVSQLELAAGRTVDQVADTAQRQLRLFFDSSALFLLSRDRRCLQGFPVNQQPRRLADMRAPMLPGDNLIAHALLEDEWVCSLDAEAFALSMLDHQLQQLLGGIGFCCIPLTARRASLGVLVLRLDSEEQAALREHHQVRGIIAALAQTLHGYLAQGPGDQAEDPARLVGEIYHELSNPISAVRNHLYVLKRNAADQEREALGQVEKEMTRIADLLAQYRQRAQNREQVSQHTGINQLVRDTVARTMDQAAQGRTIEMELADGLPDVHTNHLALEQILTNLLVNAIEATSEENTISVSTHGNWFVGDARFVEVTITDDGPGIPERIREHLFLPVTSTKGGEHSGLGLSIVRNLADEIGAMVHCQSDRHGTRFQVLVPCQQNHNENKEATRHAARQPH